MFCRSYSVLVKVYSKPKINVVRTISDRLSGGDRDPAPLFFNPDVQQLLKKLTRIDLKKVFRTRRYGEKLTRPGYKFLTTEELTEYMREAELKAVEKLQMPPVLKKNTNEVEVLSRDYELQQHNDAKFVFTDITFGKSDRERLIVVRDPDGILRKATLEERHRMNETYFPQPGKKLELPRMFEKEYLKRLLDQGKYEFVLDRACFQFEPDDPTYQDVTTTTYEAVEAAQHYDSLRSTRHFGPFAFHLAWNQCIDNLLLDLIRTDKLDEAVALVQLFHLANPEAKSVRTRLEPGGEHKFIQAYIEVDSNKKAALELALQASVELWKQREEVEAGIRRAHGHT